MWCVCMCMYVCVYTIFPSIEKKTGKTTPEHKLAHTHTHINAMYGVTCTYVDIERERSDCPKRTQKRGNIYFVSHSFIFIGYWIASTPIVFRFMSVCFMCHY